MPGSKTPNCCPSSSKLTPIYCPSGYRLTAHCCPNCSKLIPISYPNGSKLTPNCCPNSSKLTLWHQRVQPPHGCCSVEQLGAISYTVTTSVTTPVVAAQLRRPLPPIYPPLINLPSPVVMCNPPRGALVEKHASHLSGCLLPLRLCGYLSPPGSGITIVGPRVRRDDPPPVQLTLPTARSVPRLRPPSLSVCSHS